MTVGKRGKTQTKRIGGETFASCQVRKGGKICFGLAGKRLCERAGKRVTGKCGKQRPLMWTLQTDWKR